MSNKNLKILVIDDQIESLNVLLEYLECKGFFTIVALSGEIALKLLAEEAPDLILLDVNMPRMDGFTTCLHIQQLENNKNTPIIFMSSLSDVVDKLRGFEVGGVDYITKPIDFAEVEARINTHLTISQQRHELMIKNDQLTAQNQKLLNLNEELQQEIKKRKQEVEKRKEVEEILETADEKISLISQQEAKHWGIFSFIGKSKTTQQILEEIRCLQNIKKTSVLILGESGTGKELIARAIHFGGIKSNGPFIAVNCSAVPYELAESTFFGHTRGAFSGAVQNRKGLFELAQGGTLFLDEIGDMPMGLQAKLLRTLDDGSILPLGASQQKKIDVRIIAATNLDLKMKIEQGQFRSDLYFRLAGFEVNLPPLRKRKEDICLLAKHFLEIYSHEMSYANANLDEKTLNVLQEHSFPGNIRELKNIIESALIRSRGKTILPQHLNLVEKQHNFTQETLLDNYEQKIIDYIKVHDQINNSQCRKLLEVNFEQASYILGTMKQKNILRQQGKRRWSVYKLVDP